MADLYWDEDGVNGRPSSMEILLQWLSDHVNAERWQESSSERDVVVNAIYDSLLARGIKHRSRGSVDVKVRELMHSFEKVEHWLQRKGIRYLDRNTRAECKVLKACPYYRELSSLLQSSRFVGVASSQSHSRDEVSARMVNNLEHSDDVAELDIGSDNGETTRVKLNDGKTGMHDADRRCLLEAETAVRHELFKIELQAKRDEAICVRVKSRKELLDLGVTSEEVDRLMPL
ncbi:hypothetical protein PC129_g5421 [Phytophthora cactorum]|uniref:Uncharacterized protein n=1 Tax=Phytophthora cactorum TaxID=29920 RepID=A0A329SRJ8_9STRA|nr:hypothetical protein Pcac1_g14867 [Phytophthora cactorum]KAG2832971.1 hypothetical protein PC112_g6682 [Phytophthora cactorum]KAG2835382.1 hypothetical protein PC111_g5453 [Phytophthora cactorum]KAG2860889.1 hypothetical protein PC113_g7667 [Phytophthora cactorum]KAG2902088.1 hypothetical protein PC115_g15705 [Phytophthora cactorum]